MWSESALMNGESTGIILINSRVVSKNQWIDSKTEYPLILWFPVLWDNMGSDFLAFFDSSTDSVHFHSKYFPEDYFGNIVSNDFRWIFSQVKSIFA